MDSEINVNMPSTLTIEASATIENDAYITFLFELVNKTIDVVSNKIYNGSVIPNKEFCIMCGSNTNSAAANIA